jgi:transaldolase / glucose-6-phosphate isomerase
MQSKIRQISAHGQAIWLDFISRELLRTGKLRDLVNEGITGVTSNPTIFQKAIAAGREYDDSIREMVNQGLTPYQVYEALAIQDIAEAADVLQSVYRETDARDGFVSLEVNPSLAHDAAGTIAEARRLHAAVARRNVMIKVPATAAGIEAIRTLIGEGVNVNVTLIFSIAMYEKVMQAYIDGLRTLKAAGRPLAYVASVASFFVSRVDSVIDDVLTRRIEAGERNLSMLRGQMAVANAQIAYDCFKSVFESDAFRDLKASAARVQRPLWASTGTKNPAYASTKYVDALIGPHTVNTVPPATLDALRQLATPARTIDLDTQQAYAHAERLKSAGIDFAAVTDALLTDGLKQFSDSFALMLNDVATKMARFGRPTQAK